MGIYPKEMKIYVYTKNYMHMVIATLFIINKKLYKSQDAVLVYG